LELQEEGKLVTSDDPPVPFSCLNADFVKQVCSEYNGVVYISWSAFKPRLYDQHLEKLKIEEHIYISYDEW